MTADDLILSLVRDLEPVTPLASPAVRAWRWAFAALVGGGLAVGLLGVRPDIAWAATTVAFQAHSSLLLLATLTAAVAALMMAVPGELVRPWRRAVPALAIVTWIAWLIAELGIAVSAGAAEAWRIDAGWHCIWLALAVGVVPGTTLFWMIGRGAALDLRQAAMFAGLAGAGVGALGVEFICPKIAPMHLIVWHAVPALTLTVIAGVAGASALRVLHADKTPLS